MTSFVAGHCVPTCDALVDCGLHAGGFGFVALTGFTVEAAWASGSGSSGPFGSPGYVGCTNLNDAGWPLTSTELTVMFGPVWPALFVRMFVRSKSKLSSLRH